MTKVETGKSGKGFRGEKNASVARRKAGGRAHFAVENSNLSYKKTNIGTDFFEK
jgi:hypothetical protein